MARGGGVYSSGSKGGGVYSSGSKGGGGSGGEKGWVPLPRWGVGTLMTELLYFYFLLLFLPSSLSFISESEVL